VIPQYRVDVGGLVLHPDIADPLRGIVVEAESWEYHGKRQADFERDCERYTLLAVSGWLVLRFTWKQVMHRPEWVVARINQAVAAAARCA
jgi:very-short-patch-repair endonuclease